MIENIQFLNTSNSDENALFMFTVKFQLLCLTYLAVELSKVSKYKYISILRYWDSFNTHFLEYQYTRTSWAFSPSFFHQQVDTHVQDSGSKSKVGSGFSKPVH